MDQTKDIFIRPPLRLRVTRTQPCAYLKDQVEQRLAGDISACPEEHDSLAEAGFRRVENWAYKPACPQCHACTPIRVACNDFVPSRNLKRIKSRNADLSRHINGGRLSLQHYDIFQRYLATRHEDGQMTGMGFDEFSAMILNSPIRTCLFEYTNSDDQLLACMLVDTQRDGLSAVYSFFEPETEDRSLGSFMIADMIALCRETGLPYLYLGYFISQSRKMAYKARFRPYQLFQDGVWKTAP